MKTSCLRSSKASVTRDRVACRLWSRHSGDGSLQQRERKGHILGSRGRGSRTHRAKGTASRPRNWCLPSPTQGSHLDITFVQAEPGAQELLPRHLGSLSRARLVCLLLSLNYLSRAAVPHYLCVMAPENRAGCPVSSRDAGALRLPGVLPAIPHPSPAAPPSSQASLRLGGPVSRSSLREAPAPLRDKAGGCL